MITQNEQYAKVLDTVIQALTEWCGVEEESVGLSDSTVTLSKGHPYVFGHAMMDMHISLGLVPSYLPNTEYTHFPTVQSIVTYLLKQVK